MTQSLPRRKSASVAGLSRSVTHRASGWLVGLVMMVAVGTAVAQPQSASAEGAPAISTVLAAHPIVVSLAETLSEGTGIEVVRAVPANLPYTRWASYFDRRGAAALRRDAERADAVLTLRSLWADDPLYPLARRANIRIVEIDAAQPVDGALPGIAMQAAARNASNPGTPPIAAQPWLSPSNLGRMADIVAADLQRLAPEARQALAQNLAVFKQRLVALTAQAEATLASAPNVSVIVLSDRLDYLVSALNLDKVPFEQEGDEWDQASIDRLAATVQDNDAAAVLFHTALPEAVHSGLSESNPDVAFLMLESAATSGDVQATVETVVQALRTNEDK